MSSLKFNGDGAWFVTPDNKYGLSTYPMKNITEGEFSFLTHIKVDWDKMNPDDLTRNGGVMVKNGRHLGLSVVKPDYEHVYIKATIWVIDESDPSGVRNVDILVKANWDASDLDKSYKIGFSFKPKEKLLSVYCNGTWYSEKYEGELMDYSYAWLWMGASNPLDSCPEPFREFFFGEIYYAAIFSKGLTREEINEVYDNPNNVSKRLHPVCIFDFERRTPYKILDISGVGNNLIRFDKEWMDSI